MNKRQKTTHPCTHAPMHPRTHEPMHPSTHAPVHLKAIIKRIHELFSRKRGKQARLWYVQENLSRLDLWNLRNWSGRRPGSPGILQLRVSSGGPRNARWHLPSPRTLLPVATAGCPCPKTWPGTGQPENLTRYWYWRPKGSSRKSTMVSHAIMKHKLQKQKYLISLNFKI